MTQLVDIGVNLTNSRFKDDLANVLQRVHQANVGTLIITGTDVEESETAQQLCCNYQDEHDIQLYCTAGIHPHDAGKYAASNATLDSAISALRELAAHPQVVAAGEMGLDFNRNFSTPKDQQTLFEHQLVLASETGLPLFLHERDAHERQLAILKEHRDSISGGVAHCFTGSKKELYNYLDLDLYIGITGWVCDERRGSDLQQLVKDIPANRLMVETDAPFLLPRSLKPKPKSSRNEPAYLPHIIETIAKFRVETSEQLEKITAVNARQFFNLAT